MGRDLSKSECESLEALVDATGIGSVLMALSEICGAKAEQDAPLAKRWTYIKVAIGVIVFKAMGL